jgi:hypothetical protein
MPPVPAKRGRRGDEPGMPGAEAVPVQLGPRRFVSRVPAYVPNGGLGAGVSATERRSAQDGSAGHRDDHAARRQRFPQCRPGPGEDVPGVGVPVAAEGLPGLLVYGRHVRLAPALRTSRLGRCSRITFCASASPVASAATGVKPSPSSSRTASSLCSSRAMPTTLVPVVTSTAAIARPKPWRRPSPPTTAASRPPSPTLPTKAWINEPLPSTIDTTEDQQPSNAA